METTQNPQNRELDILGFLIRVLKRSILFLLITAILGGLIGLLYAAKTSKKIYSAQIIFWISNLSTNYDYTSQAQTAAASTIASQMPDLIVTEAPLREAVVAYKMECVLGFIDQQTEDTARNYYEKKQKLAAAEDELWRVQNKTSTAEELTAAEEARDAAKDAFLALDADATVKAAVAQYDAQYDAAVNDAIRFIKKSIVAGTNAEQTFMFYARFQTDDANKTLAIANAVQETFPSFASGLMRLRKNEENTPLVTLIDPVHDQKDITVGTTLSLGKGAAIGAFAALFVCYAVFCVLEWYRWKKEIPVSPDEEEKGDPNGEV